jgi:hypothetical protein
MRRIAIFAAVLAVAGVTASSLGASDTRGPACTNITSGDFGYNSTTGNFGGSETLAAAACSTYELDVYDASGTTLLAHLTGTIDPLDPSMTTIAFPTTNVGANRTGVCIIGTSTWSEHIADYAPNPPGCFFVDATSSGGSQGFS